MRSGWQTPTPACSVPASHVSLDEPVGSFTVALEGSRISSRSRTEAWPSQEDR
jgi:hypothetical protein